jgi:hypothetical protein
MPGDPKECREHAKRCLKIAQEATNPALRASLEDIAQQWLRLAADLEATKPLLGAWGDPSFLGKLTLNYSSAVTLTRRAAQPRTSVADSEQWFTQPKTERHDLAATTVCEDTREMQLAQKKSHAGT